MAVAKTRSPISYPIRAVSKLTGISIDTLRAWERRHGVVKPGRDDRGRVYTKADIARLQLVSAAVERGHAIGRVAQLSDEEFKELLAGSTGSGARAAPALGGREPTVPLTEVAEAMDRFDPVALEREFTRLSTLLTAREIVHQVIVPVMHKVGDDWYRGRLNVAQEHLTSAMLRSLVGTVMRLHVRLDAPSRLLFTTPSGERHEFGVLAAALLTAASGLGVVYLGPDLPAEETAEAARRMMVQVVAVGITAAGETREPFRQLKRLAERLPPRTELWVGGRGAVKAVRDLGSRILVLPDLRAFEQQLMRFGGRL